MISTSLIVLGQRYELHQVAQLTGSHLLTMRHCVPAAALLAKLILSLMRLQKPVRGSGEHAACPPAPSSG